MFVHRWLVIAALYYFLLILVRHSDFLVEIDQYRILVSVDIFVISVL